MGARMKAGERYVLSRMGIVSALGRGAAETAARAKAGDTSGMVPVEGLSGGGRTVFGFAAGFPRPRRADGRGALPDGTPRVCALVDAAMEQISDAVEAAKAEYGAKRVGAVVGTSNSTMEEFTDRPDRIDMSRPAARLRERWGVEGPCWAVSTACSSSAKAFASARRLIRCGACDAAVVGGADAFTRAVLEGFHALEALSPGLSRPLSPDRDGINLGEGAALFLMLRADAADAAGAGRAPGAQRVELIGAGESSDAYHPTAPDPDGRGAEAAMRAALADAGIGPDGIDFLNLHGTGTVQNDAMECEAARRVFGGRAPREGASPADGLGVRAFSTKRLTGHCLGAAGAIEAALCWIELSERPAVCMSNSFAFGGSNASIILSSRAPSADLL